MACSSCTVLAIKPIWKSVKVRWMRTTDSVFEVLQLTRQVPVGHAGRRRGAFKRLNALPGSRDNRRRPVQALAPLATSPSIVAGAGSSGSV